LQAEHDCPRLKVAVNVLCSSPRNMDLPQLRMIVGTLHHACHATWERSARRPQECAVEFRGVFTVERLAAPSSAPSDLLTDEEEVGVRRFLLALRRKTRTYLTMQ
jgi:hypothetical protein